MIRKSFLWGLMVVLVAVVIGLVIRGRRLERQQDAQGVEVVQKSESIPTRVLSPHDLEIVNSTMRLESRATAGHKVEIHNNGSVPYNQMQLRFAFLDRSGIVLATKTRLIAQTVMPGKSITVADIAVNEIPTSTVTSKISILCADIGSVPAQGR